MASQIISSLGVKNWTVDRLPELQAKQFVITGANSGIGFEAARMLGEQGADLILACRSPQKAEQARQSLQASTKGTIDLVTLDLSDGASIRRAAESVRILTKKIDGLINNAGIMQTPQLETADGFEMQFGTNHLGHFLWTSLLLDLVEAAQGRVVQLSSIAHKLGRINWNDPMLSGAYNASTAYSQSKLANIMFAFELDRRLAQAGRRATACACHPGYSNTNLQSTGPTGILNLFYKPLNALLAQPQTMGAVPTVLSAAGVEAKRGAYYGPTGIFDLRGPVSDSSVADHARVEEDWKRLWELSEDLVGIEFRI
ncbi:oxidoreductase [uncultured Cohaesibacter sp.]|uniref:oxidoreductase n=1 Tax=uncultured Cohaesibacter sp. TaxID=1002546 RepID=UPI0029C97B09|nr:oxidoreductase [uncultured Cohaesibacter sp.]